MLKRENVFEYIGKMYGKQLNYYVQPAVKMKANHELPDYLMCGERCFGIIFERDGRVFHLILRLSEESAKRFGERYRVSRAAFQSGMNWYSITIDQSYKSKDEIYKILEESYVFTQKTYYDKKNASKTLPAKAEQAVLEKEITAILSFQNKKFSDAEKAYREAAGFKDENLTSGEKENLNESA